MLGPNGDGTAAHFGLVDEVDIIAGTFSKSLASIGGFVAASDNVIHYLRHHSRPLMFTASLPPANTAGVLAALEVLQREPERRSAALGDPRRLHDGFRQLGYDIGPTETPIVPVLIGPMEKTFLFWRKLYDAGVFTNPVAPPAVPPSQCRLRTSLMATHTFDQIDYALHVLNASAGSWRLSDRTGARPSGARKEKTSSGSSICPIDSMRGTLTGSRRCVGTSPPCSIAPGIRSSSTPPPSTSSPNGKGRIVGRIAAIHNRLHNQTHGDRVGFFGFFESKDDQAVTRSAARRGGGLAEASWARYHARPGVLFGER